MDKTLDLFTEEQNVYEENLPADKAGTAEDREAMRRLGKKQLFKVFAPLHDCGLAY